LASFVFYFIFILSLNNHLDPFYRDRFYLGPFLPGPFLPGPFLPAPSNESVTTAIFGDLIGYFFGSFRDKASNII